MNTDVFPEEDSVPVVWSHLHKGWGVKNPDDERTRFNSNVHGYTDRWVRGSYCATMPLHEGDLADDEGVEHCFNDGVRTNLPLAINRIKSKNYLAGLTSAKHTEPSWESSSYRLGRELADLIDWQA